MILPDTWSVLVATGALPVSSLPEEEERWILLLWLGRMEEVHLPYTAPEGSPVEGMSTRRD